MVVEEIKITKKLILALLFCVGLALPARGTGAATLYFSPSSGTYNTGRNFTVSVKVSTNVPVNAVSAVINYPNNNLEAVGISKTGSVVNLWVQEPSFSNTDSLGNVRFEGVVLNPGFIGSLGKIITKVLGFIMPMAGIILLFVLISGGYDYMMSQGNADKVKSAQGKITSGIIGFILLIVSFLIVRLIAVIFGLGEGIF